MRQADVASGPKTKALGSVGPVPEDPTLAGLAERDGRATLLGHFATEIAHDLNHVLTIVLHAADTIDERARIDLAGGSPGFADQIREAAGDIRLAAERGAWLVRRIVRFGRTAAEEVRPILADAALDEVVAFARRLLGASFEVRAASRASEARVYIDEGQLDRMLLNLIVNARDASPTGGIVTLSASVERDPSAPLEEVGSGTARVAFVVEDDGPGIRPADLERIFEPFFTTRGAAGGSGIGLASVREIARANGGDVLVESWPGQGTRATIRLPLWEQPVSRPAPEADMLDPSGRGELVLVVEDEALLRRLIAGRLSRAGWDVITAGSGEEALQKVRQGLRRPVSAVIADLSLPGISGVALVSALRSSLGRPDLPAIVSSGRSGASLRAAAAMAEGDAVSVQVKPYRLSELIEMLAGLLSSRPAPDRSRPDQPSSSRSMTVGLPAIQSVASHSTDQARL